MEKLFALLNKLSKFYPSFLEGCIPVDKFLHFVTGAGGAVVLSLFIGFWAVAVISAMAVLKEWYDYKHPLIHTADFLDGVATTLGGLFGGLLVYALTT